MQRTVRTFRLLVVGSTYKHILSYSARSTRTALNPLYFSIGSIDEMPRSNISPITSFRNEHLQSDIQTMQFHLGGIREILRRAHPKLRPRLNREVIRYTEHLHRILDNIIEGAEGNGEQKEERDGDRAEKRHGVSATPHEPSPYGDQTVKPDRDDERSRERVAPRKATNHQEQIPVTGPRRSMRIRNRGRQLRGGPSSS